MTSYTKRTRRVIINGKVIEDTTESFNGRADDFGNDFNAFVNNQTEMINNWGNHGGQQLVYHTGEDFEEEQFDDQGENDDQEQPSITPEEGRAGFTPTQIACQRSALDLHNSLRARHGVQPLVLDDAINSKAQAYAEYLANNNLFQHSKDRNGLGENLYTYWSSKPQPNSDHGKSATQSWYDEIKDYNFNKQGFSMNTGHFTQVVWKSTMKLGVGIAFAEGNRKVIIVANYGPAGNVQGHYQQNVFPPR